MSFIVCPKCGSKNAKREVYSGDVCVEEEYINCPDCGYFYMFSYGFQEEGFADVPAHVPEEMQGE